MVTRQMKLEGIHHVTCITGDAHRNLDFYTRVLGLRLVKKTVNQDDPTVYHLFYADENGSPGSDITFFEYPNAKPGRAGAGMVHRIVWRLGGRDALDFWQKRLAGEGVSVEGDDGSVRFADPEGLEHEFAVVQTDDEPLVAEHADIPKEFALHGFHGVRAYARAPDASRPFLEESLSFQPSSEGESWEVRGADRGGHYHLDSPPGEPGVGGAGTVHHVAWASRMEDDEAWRERAERGGASPTPVIDRFWFRSIYFREPSGVLFEIATLGPGFTTDESLERLGESLVLPPAFEHLREQVEQVLTPLQNPRSARASR